MKKRIGSRIYNTETADLIYEEGGLHIYRKQTRGRECFAVEGEELRPLTAEESAHYCEPAEPSVYLVRLDRESHSLLAELAKAEDCSMSEAVKRLIFNSGR